MTRAWIFDFDGTLVHSEAAITQCFQRITKKLAPHRLDVAKQVLIGPPLRHTVAEILGDPDHPLIDEFVASFIKIHDEEILTHAKAYPQTQETLKNLYQMGNKMAIATNKRQAPTKKIIEHLGWDHFFVSVECSDCGGRITSKSEMIDTIIKKDNNFKGAFMVGDTINDALAAKKNKLPFVKAAYGYGKLQDWSKIVIAKNIDTINELLDYSP